jgi:hypothetical protein
MIRNLWRWLQGQVVQDVPDSLAVCEFDCRSTACRRGEWERCEHRLAKVRLMELTRKGDAPGLRGQGPG